MARLLRKTDGEQLVLPGRISTEIVGAGSGARSVTVRLVEVPPPGPGEVERGPHVHYGFEECIHVLSGRVEIVLDGDEFHDLGTGDSLYFDSRRHHSWSNRHDGETVLIWINTPPTF